MAPWDERQDKLEYTEDGELKKQHYKAELNRLQEELVTLQHWVEAEGMPPRSERETYDRPPIHEQNWVPAVYGTNPVDGSAGE